MNVKRKARAERLAEIKKQREKQVYIMSITGRFEKQVLTEKQAVEFAKRFKKLEDFSIYHAIKFLDKLKQKYDNIVVRDRKLYQVNNSVSFSFYLFDIKYNCYIKFR